MVFASVFAIMVGLGMIIQWTMSYVFKQIPELDTEPIRIWFPLTMTSHRCWSSLVAGSPIEISHQVFR